MTWAVKLLQENFNNVPLALDTANMRAIEAGIKVYNRTNGKPIVNSADAGSRIGYIDLAAANDAFCENGVQILGDKGYIKVTPSPSTCQSVTIILRKDDDIHFELPENPWLYEMIGLVELIRNKDFDECYRRLDVALQVVEVLEEARKSGGLNF